MQRGKGRTPDGAGVGQYLGHGLTWVGSTLLFLFIGRALDRWLGTGDILALLGAFLGAAAGFWSMYRHLVVEPRRRQEREERGE